MLKQYPMGMHMDAEVQMTVDGLENTNDREGKKVISKAKYLEELRTRCLNQNCGENPRFYLGILNAKTSLRFFSGFFLLLL